jgi:hypothetical protein
MMNIQKIESVLSRMRDLLIAGAISDWASALDGCRSDLSVDPVSVRSRILAMYGGMGSLNDLVLYRNGQPMVRENNELDALRSELYSLCHDTP